MWKLSLVLLASVISVIHSIPCIKQPLSFGPNCSLVCHCLSSVCDARTEGIGCLSGSCSPGYTGFPQCQQQCQRGTFGVDCTARCNCEPENICEPTNGNCIGNNRCKLGHYGAGCQGVRTQLLASPEVSSNCADIILSWPDLSSISYIGSPDITRFVVLYRSSTTSQLYQTSNFIKASNTTAHTFTFTPEELTANYEFSVRPDFLVSIPPDAYIETGLPSPWTASCTAQCASLPGFSLTVSGSNATATWQVHPNLHVKTVKLVFTPTSVGDCKNLSTTEASTQPQTCEAPISLLSCKVTLNPWTNYSVKAFGETDRRIETAAVSRNITTSEAAPIGIPSNLSLLGEPSDKEATVNWAPPPCTMRNGPLQSWVIQLRPEAGAFIKPTDVRTSSPPLHISQLSPGTSYVLRVAYRNSVGTGPFAELLFSTKSESFSGFPTDVRTSTIQHDSGLITWLPPDPATLTGILSGYEVEHWPHNWSSARKTSVLLPPDQTSYSITELTAQTTYYVQVFSVFSSERVPSKTISFQTLPQPTAQSWVKIELLDRSASSIRISLSVQGVAVAPEQLFTLSISRLQSLLPVVSEFIDETRTVAINQKLIEPFSNLPAASQYQISVYASTRAAIQGAKLTIWTAPQPFSLSTSLHLGEFSWISESPKSVTVRFPTVSGYVGGPLNGFYIVVSQLTGQLSTGTLEDLKRKTSMALPKGSSTWIAFYSQTMPTQAIVVGGGNSVANPGRTPILMGRSLSNRFLEAGKTYAIYAVVESNVDGASSDLIAGSLKLTTKSVASEALISTQAGKAVNSNVLGVVLSILLFMFVILLLGTVTYCVCTRNGSFVPGKFLPKNAQMTAKVNSLMDEYDRLLPQSYALWSAPLDSREPRHLIIAPEEGPTSTLVGTWTKKELSDTYMREYASIPMGFRYPHKAGELNINKSKNRTQSVLPYDHNRVALKRSPDSGDTDYINASFVDGYMRRRAYIACQSPFDTPTAGDFWLMVFQRNVSQIVMLTNLVEDGKLKCCQYWPDISLHTTLSRNEEKNDDSAQTQYFGQLTVQAVDRIDYAHFTVRQFIVTDSTTGVSQRVVQYHFQSWGSPRDKHFNAAEVGSSITLLKESELGNTNISCVVEDEITGTTTDFFANSNVQFEIQAFIEFYYRVKTASRPEDGPVVVHCDTGLARTGLYIAFDTLLQQATHERVVSVARQCTTLSKARANMFNSVQSYMLLYDLLFEALIAGPAIVDLDVLSTYHMLNHKNSKVGRSFLYEQWSVLHHFTPLPDPDKDLRVALSASNARRNRCGRDINLLPAECWRPHLRPRSNVPDYTDYINAVFLDGTSLRDDLILTQTPLAVTVDDFWSLVDEEKVSCIVDMEPFGYGINGAVRYWPLRAGEINTEPLFEGSSDEERTRPDTQSDADDAAATRGPWCPVAGGYLQVCQVGQLTQVSLDASGRKSNSSTHGIYRRRLLVRCIGRRNKASYPDHHERSKRREVLIFHFAGDWNTATQVPESRAAIVRLLEAIRLERGTGPLLIHCLDGATRSGLLGVCHLLAERMTRDHYVALFHVIKGVKIRRRAVIASQEQLRFVYRLLAQWIKQTLSEPLAAWTARHMGDVGDVSGKRQWPHLLGHLPSYVRAGIYSTSQLPALVADGSSVTLRSEEGGTMANVNNSLKTGESNENVPCPLYHYFHEEVLTQRCTRSQNWNSSVSKPTHVSDSWSTGSMNQLGYSDVTHSHKTGEI